MAIPFHFLLFLGRWGGGGGGGGGCCRGDETTIFVFFIFGRETAKPPIFALKDITKHI